MLLNVIFKTKNTKQELGYMKPTDNKMSCILQHSLPLVENDGQSR